MAKHHSAKTYSISSFKLLPLALLTAFVLSQAFGLAHLYQHQAVGHQTEGDSDHCVVCFEAAHLGHAALPQAVVVSSLSVITQALYEEVLHLLQTASLRPYASRAPPLTV